VQATVAPASTWLGVLTGPSFDCGITYRVETDGDRPEEPPWVEGLERQAANESR
jgi:hypothetical protein